MTKSNNGRNSNLIEKSSKKRLLRFVRLLFVLSVFILLWRVFDGEEAIRLLFDANPLLLLAGFISLSLQTVLSALRWRLTASQLGITIGPKRALSEYYLSQIANQSLPGGVLGDAGRVIRSSSQAGWVISAKAVLIERMAGQITLFTLFFVSLGANLLLPTNLLLPQWLLITTLLVLGITFAMVLFLIGFIKANRSNLVPKITNFTADIYKSLLAKNVRWPQLGLSLVAAVLNIFGFIFASWAIGAEISIGIAFVIVPIILLAMLVPLSIGGWGIREAVAASLFPLAGALQTEGLAASVGFGLLFLLASLPGVLVALFRTGRDSNSEELGAS